MANIKLYLDARAVKPGQTAPLKFVVTHQHKAANIPTGIRILPEQWDATAEKVISHPRRNNINARLLARRYELTQALEEITGLAAKKNLTAIQLRDAIVSRADQEESEDTAPAGNFLQHFQHFAQSRKAPNTQAVYTATIRRLESYDPTLHIRTFEDITKAYITDFERFLAKTSTSQNARNIHLRNIRAVFNDAIDNNITATYPFRHITIKPVPTRHRNLTLHRMRQIFSAQPPEWAQKYIDAFRLSFLMRGINLVDLCNLTAPCEGRVNFHRAKTNQPISIRLEPEAIAIISRYRGTNHLLNFAEQQTYSSFYHNVNRALHHTFGPDITYYWARHTWATFAAELDIPRETIAHALGHASDYNSVTDRYIRFNEKKADQANRQVINYVLSEQ